VEFPTDELPQSEIDALIEVIRKVTGDRTMVLHSLRHSFVTALILRLFLPVSEIKGTRWESVLNWYDTGGNVDRARFRFLGNEQLPPHSLYLVACLAGHASPAQTISTYGHCFDVISGFYVSRAIPELSPTTWASIEGASVDAVMARSSRRRRVAAAPYRPEEDCPRRLLRAAKIPLPTGRSTQPYEDPTTGKKSASSRLDEFTLESAYAIIASFNRAMAKGIREALTGRSTDELERLRKAAMKLAARKTATRNRDAARPRLLAPALPRRRPKLHQLPQLDGLGPALPKGKDERAQARGAFKAVTQELARDDLPDLGDLLASTSHSQGTVRTRDLGHLIRAIDLMVGLGIAKSDLRVVIASVPRNTREPLAWCQKVAKAVDLDAGQVRLLDPSKPVETRSERTHPDGSILLEVLQQDQSDSWARDDVDAKPRKRAYGWRVGAYYGFCARWASGV